MFNDLVVNGIPLILLVFGIVEFIKRFGLSGNILIIISMVLGVLLYFAYSFANLGMPSAFGEWFNVIFTGLCFGLVASGVYDFAKRIAQ